MLDVQPIGGHTMRIYLGLVAHAVLEAAHPAAVLRHHLPLGSHLVNAVAIQCQYDVITMSMRC